MKNYLKVLNKYKNLMENSMFPYHSEDEYKKYFGRVPKFRYHTLKYSLDYFFKNNFKTIVELGTSRSFVDGKFPGCNQDNIKYWEPDNSEKWDWSAGCFTRIISESIQDTDIDFITIDLDQRHINRSKIMTKEFNNIEYYVMSSEEFLTNGQGKIDFLYMDTGDMTPIEPTAELHLRESQIIVERNLITDNGIILIDDVMSPVSKITSNEESNYGKAKYSIPYLESNGFEIVMSEYQVVMIKKN